MADLSPLIAAMLEPGFYPARPRRVRLIQTHISYVFLAGRFVYKLRKPVRLPFLDFSSRAARLRDCRAEVRLNRRFAPGVYLGVVPIGRRDGRFVLGARPAEEHAVRMRRLPDRRRLAALVGRGRPPERLAARLGRHLTALHARAPRGPAITRHGAPSAIRRLWRENVRTLERFTDSLVSGAALARLADAGERFVRTQTTLLRRRQREGFIRDGHGDLHAEHVYVLPAGRPGGIVLIDGLEFSARLRCGDVASELAFLVMDLEHRGAPEFAATLAAAYQAATVDPDLPRLLPFYRCYRAMVRAKVCALLASEPEVAESERTAARRQAREFVTLALRAAWESRDRMLIVCAGPSGSGKSTIAGALSAESGFVHLASDVIRKELAGLDPTASGRTVPDLYTPRMSARTYATLYSRARETLGRGRSVILDATFLRRADRDVARRLAAEAGAAALVLDCRARDDTVRARLAARTPAAAHGSDAGVAVYLRQRPALSRSLDVPGLARVLVATDGDLTAVIDGAIARVWAWGGGSDGEPRLSSRSGTARSA